ncbi:Hypothetical protein MVR_LOCUS240 [uncultured virus]|nr:Hypothetical protein MVR_LOCUS240 [uncultured virus]
MIVLSWDVGIVTLSYCLLQVDDDLLEQLLNTKSKQSLRHCLLTNIMHLSILAWESLSILTEADATQNINPNCNKIPINQLELLMYRKLDTKLDLFSQHDITDILIELQPSTITQTMKSLSIGLANYFQIRGFIDKTHFPSLQRINYIHATSKSKLFVNTSHVSAEPLSQAQKYTQRKKTSMTTALEIITSMTDVNVYVDWFLGFQVQYDPSDALLQALVYSLDKLPKHLKAARVN